MTNVKGMSEDHADYHQLKLYYCLRCYHQLPGEEKTCPICGFVSLLADRKKYWNRESGLIRLERITKIIVIVLGEVVFGSIAACYSHMGGTGAGWFIALPVFLMIPLWQTASKLTKKAALFHAGFFWSQFFFISSIALFFFRMYRSPQAFWL